MPIEERPARRPAPRTCKRCGQPINTQTDSWEMKRSEDGQYAVGIQHITCPPGPELQNLPPPDAPLFDREGAPLAAGVGSSDPPVFLTMDEAALLIRVSKQTIRRLIRSGDLPAKRLRNGQTVLIDRRDVLALLEEIVPGADL